jgi:hypothetical protein
VARDPSWFLHVVSRGEALCGLEVCGVGVLLLLGGCFSAKCAPASKQEFLFMEFMLSASSLFTILDPLFSNL